MSPFLWLLLLVRSLQKKETKISRAHRFANFDIPHKQNNRIWFHAASVGESLIALNIAQHLRGLRPELEFVFTCQTQTAAQIIETRKNQNDIFLFAPFDHKAIAKRFVKRVQVDLAVFIEGEIWPNLIEALRKNNSKIALLNSRMTKKSIENWLKSPSLAKAAFSSFDFAHAANEQTYQFLSQISPNLCSSVCNLKYTAPPLEVNSREIAELRQVIGQRKIWLCASSHDGEEELILNAHKKICETYNDCLLIIAPRHLQRANAIQAIAKNMGFDCALRSKLEAPNEMQGIFIWDVLGQMGNFYKLGDFAFIAGSLLPQIGGHNPIEPAQLECAIITGPHFHNFLDIFTDLKNRNAAIITKDDTDSICDTVLNIFNRTTNIDDMKKNALNFVNESKSLLQEIDQSLLELLDSK